ncbi:hypothetical protein TW80_17135 [Loktanella sp. S4079]|nr:hypothetical protein TW80_17135 [Loktanella sp. S4079]
MARSNIAGDVLGNDTEIKGNTTQINDCRSGFFSTVITPPAQNTIAIAYGGLPPCYFAIF